MKRNVVIGMVAALLAVIVAWYLIIYSPKGDSLDKTKADVAAERKTTQDLRGRLSRLQAEAKNASRQQALLGRLNDAVPEQPDEAEFILQANAIAQESGIEFLSISPTPPVGGAGPSTIGLTITINGSFFQVKNYLTKLESLERLVIVDGINLSSGASTGTSTDAASTGDGVTLSVTLTARMFTQAAATTVGPDGTVQPPTTPSTSTPTDGSSTSSSPNPAGSSTTGGT